MFCGLAVGRLLDKCTRVSLFLILFILFEIASNLIYVVADSPKWILISRLVGGTEFTKTL